MKKLFCLLPIVLTGCANLTGNWASVVQELGKDPACVQADIQTPYGSLRYRRVGGEHLNQPITVGDNGVAITSAAKAPVVPGLTGEGQK